MKRDTILITGGAGYVGSHAVRRLFLAGFQPVVFDVRCPAAAINHVEYYRGDIRNNRNLLAAFSRYHPVCVVHLAAITENRTRSQNSKTLWDVNVVGSENVARITFRHNCLGLVFASSAAVYGDANRAASETQQLHPKNTYGATKKETENFLLKQTTETPRHIAVLRIFNVAGNNANVCLTHATDARKTLLLNALRVTQGKKKRLVIYGNKFPTQDGTAIRDYVHVDDVSEAIYKASLHVLSKKKNVIVNVGSGIGTTNLTVVKTMERISGRPIYLHYGRPNAKEIVSSVAQINHTLAVLKWSPHRSDIRTIVQSTCEYYDNT